LLSSFTSRSLRPLRGRNLGCFRRLQLTHLPLQPFNRPRCFRTLGIAFSRGF
jgi:hypothetical protein